MSNRVGDKEGRREEGRKERVLDGFLGRSNKVSLASLYSVSRVHGSLARNILTSWLGRVAIDD